MNDYTVFTPKTACGEDDAVFAQNAPLAMAFVRDQKWEKPLDAMNALRYGSAFRSLVKPFWGKGVADDEQH